MPLAYPPTKAINKEPNIKPPRKEVFSKWFVFDYTSFLVRWQDEFTEKDVLKMSNEKSKEGLIKQLINEAASLSDDDLAEVLFAIPYVLRSDLSHEEIHQLYIKAKRNPSQNLHPEDEKVQCHE